MKKIICFIIILFSITGTSCLNASALPSADTDLLVSGFNEFAFDLYRQVENPNKNIIISPYSLSSVLGILSTGAAGNTRVQFIQLLNLKNMQTSDAMIAALNKVEKSLTSAENSQTILTANALWAAKNLSYKKSFLDVTQQNKFIHFNTVDFALNPETARKAINRWVENNTHDYIKQLIPEGSVTTQTRLILTNAIYFKGLWQIPFKRTNTQQKPFTLSNGKTIQIAMMRQEENFLYTENDTLQMLQLRYAKSNLAMAILLPKPKHTLQDIENSLNPHTFSQLLHASHEVKVDVSMPKFNLESTFPALSNPLQALGLRDAFTDKANFSNLTDGALFITDIIQKAVIKVDEEGTVAAAATGAIMSATMYEPPHLFNANHPFLYAIFDIQSGILLFMGQVVNPAI